MLRTALGVALLAALTAIFASPAQAADETSSGDKLRMLYSNQFTFTDDGLPVVTIELTSGRDEVELGSNKGIVVKPDGDSGAAIRAGKKWTITVANGRPARLREWTVVGRFHPDETSAIERAYKTWKSRGFDPRSFEIGTLFGVAGAVLDSRETLVAIAPTGKGRGKSQASRIAISRYAMKEGMLYEMMRER